MAEEEAVTMSLLTLYSTVTICAVPNVIAATVPPMSRLSKVSGDGLMRGETYTTSRQFLLATGVGSLIHRALLTTAVQRDMRAPCAGGVSTGRGSYCSAGRAVRTAKAAVAPMQGGSFPSPSC